MRTPLSAITVSLLCLTAGSSSWAAEAGLISANGVDVRESPAKHSDSMVKLYLGRRVEVHGEQDGWINVSFNVERGVDEIEMQGWVRSSQIRARSRFGFSFQREQAPAPAIAESESELDWGAEPAASREQPPENDPLAELSAEWASTNEDASAGWGAEADNESDEFDPAAWGGEESSEDGEEEPLPWE